MALTKDLHVDILIGLDQMIEIKIIELREITQWKIPMLLNWGYKTFFMTLH